MVARDKMAISIDKQSLGNAVTETCHFLPCEIEFDGEAKVSDFFVKTISPVATCEKELTASFRGRPLNGLEVDLPSGYTGLVLKEPHKRTTEDEDRTLIVTHKFDSFTQWNLDKQPTPDDLLQRALQWIDVSAALHKPVCAESSQADSQRSMKGQ